MQLGRFITIEGGEGVGKSTQLAAARQELISAGVNVVVTREPGGTDRAERIREILLNASSEPMPQACELLLMFAARSTHLHSLILPTLKRGIWVLCDRFTDATYAYQGSGRGVPASDIATLERLVQGELRPSLTLLLDAPVALAIERARSRNRERFIDNDRFEQEHLDFFERVRAGYLSIAKREPDRVKVIDASKSMEVVEQSVRLTLREFLASTSSDGAR